MSQFEGNKLKVRCIDCTKLSGNNCTAKNVVVSPKKKRLCSLYEFRGAYENRTPAPSVYMPHVDQKTRKMIKRLLNLGVVTVAEDGSRIIQDDFVHTKTLPMPSTTATASVLGEKGTDDPIIYKPSSHEIADSNIIWTTDGGDAEESENQRS